ncbi:aldehyde dehydrogenase [Cyathus striatus]|nr:aldehyde dehydrogenase [Cyathus striatus]
MPQIFNYTFDTPSYKGTSHVNTGLFINGKWVDPVEPATAEISNPATGKVVTSIAVGSSKDVDLAVEAARKAYKSSWGLKVPGSVRGKLLNKLADLVEKNADELAALDSINSGKLYGVARMGEVEAVIDTLRYYAGWADKVQGKTIETNESKFAYTRHEPYGVVGQIIPWNFALMMLAWKIAPALATGNTIVLKPSEITPLTALRVADLITEAGFPAGVVNIINGFGNTVGQAISEHPHISKVAFTGSTLVGRKVLKAAAETNLKAVTLELGGKSPSIVFDDADLEQAVKWVAHGIFLHMGQTCTAGSRIFVQAGIYDKFIAELTKVAEGLTACMGDPFSPGTQHGPQTNKAQYDRILSYIESGKSSGAHVLTGGEKGSEEGYYIKPTLFTFVDPRSEIAREEIFGPVGVVFKFTDEEEVIDLANDTAYGLAASVFTENGSRALRVSHAIEAGTIWVNCAAQPNHAIPFGGYKMSGNGRELGEYALDTYTQVKGVHVNVGMKL